jgi:hypothetical protein
MKLTVDTRYDTLESALATVREAFGAGHEQARGTQPEAVPARTAIKQAGSSRGAKKATVKCSAATRRARAKKAPPKKVGARGTAKNSAAQSAARVNVAPPGEADAIRTWARSQGMEGQERWTAADQRDHRVHGAPWRQGGPAQLTPRIRAPTG